MTTTTKSRKAPKALTFIARGTFKASGATVYAIRSGETTYHVTTLAGRVTGCCNVATGETCDGYYYRKNCAHTKYVAQLEEKRAQQLHDAEVIAPTILGESFAQDLEVHVADSIDSGEYVDPWVDPFAGMTQSERRAAYRDLYPDDFGYAA